MSLLIEFWKFLRPIITRLIVSLIKLRKKYSYKLIRDLNNSQLIGAHKGAYGFPENTYEAVKSACEQGYAIIEVDVAETADGQLVLIHDDTIDRTSDGRGRITELTYSQLSKFNFSNGLYGGGDYQQVTIPRLADILELIKEYDVILNIDVARTDRLKKDSYLKIIDLIKLYGVENKVYVEIDCSLSSMTKWLMYEPNIVYEFANVANEIIFRKILPFAKVLSTAVILNRNINPTIVKLSHENGFAVSFWTASCEELMQLAIKEGYNIIGCEFKYNCTI